MRYLNLLAIALLLTLACKGSVEKQSADSQSVTESQSDADTSQRNPNFNYARYTPTTMKDLLVKLDDILEGEQKGIYVSYGNISSKVDLICAGEIRPMDVRKFNVMNITFSSVASMTQLVNLFQHEVLFTEDSSQYWLPVQELIMPNLVSELKQGDKVSLYVYWLGAIIEEGGEYELLFLVNEFWRGPQNK